MTRADALAVLASRVDAIADAMDAVPAALARAGACGPSGLVPPDGRPIAASGVGLSEGPARILVALARASGRHARFVPLSRFAGERGPGALAPDEQLVLFSQGLSPNARLALRPRAGAPPVLVTSVAEEPPGVRVVRLPPAEAEDKLLLRVVGPATAAYAALLLAPPSGAGEHHDAIVGAYRAPVGGELRAALEAAPAGPLAFVTAGDVEPDVVFALRWKVLEGLRTGDPPLWDVLQIAHGPVQAFWEHPLTLLALVHDEDADGRALVERLRGALAPRHRLVRLPARLPGPLAFFEWDAQLDRGLVAAAARSDLALDAWPGAPVDDALYRLGAP